MYIEAIIVLNFIFDFIILFFVNFILKNKTRYRNLLFASLFGLLLIPFNFIKLPFLLAMLIRVIYGIVMVIIAFRYRNIKYTLRNLIYLYMISTIMAGFLYFLSLEIHYNILLIILVPFYLYLISYMIRDSKRNSKYTYSVQLCINNNKINLNGFLDTGNSVKDYVLKNRVLIVSNNAIERYINDHNFYYLNISTVNGNELLRCYKIDNVLVNERPLNRCVIAVTNHLNNSLYEVLIPNYLEEELC